MRNIRFLPLLMIISIGAIAAFQVYWLNKAYEREAKAVERQTNMLFRETVGFLQVTKLKLDRLDSGNHRIFIRTQEAGKPPVINQRMAGMINVMMQKMKDSSSQTVILRDSETDTVRRSGFVPRKNRLMQFMFDVDSLQDSIRVKELHTAYAKRLEEQHLDVSFAVSRIPTTENREISFNEVTLGFRDPITYRLDLVNTRGFLLKRISTPILFSVFLVGFTIFSFSLLYRNLLKQRRLGDIKNEFISNITHELKTPIATVSVAIEALRSFNATMDPARTKEYLDISANELQRLSLLVDKVLKLSMFEKKEVELKYEGLDMMALINEVTSSMRLQFEKHGAAVEVSSNGETSLEGDRLHLVSVIFNLLDNALKYSQSNPVIKIHVEGLDNKINLSVTDSGIGIPAEYHGRVFEKFFRVPTGNLHNAKGYGLGLSYVAHVVAKHKGTISVESVEGNGSRFLISLPRRH